MNVGFIGLGRMGRGMAHRIHAGGHGLAVYDVVRAQTDEFAAAGARVGASVAEVAAGCDVVVTMLVEDAAVIDLVMKPEGLRDSMPRGSIHLAMGTYGVAAIRAMARAHAGAGQTLVAAPVLGRPDLAASGQLGIVPAGPPDAVGRCDPLFKLMGRRIFLAGETPEAATAIKLANNLVLGCAMEAMAEGFSLVQKYDVPPQIFYEVMVEGLFSAPAYTGYGKTMVERGYDNVGSPITVGLKDADLILEAGELAGVPLPSGSLYRDRLIGAVAHGDGARDQAVLAREQGRACGLD
jgi:3-hydroxyisobutyrate dehydrogenase-like beta-hydroxyacid dehydrogenase